MKVAALTVEQFRALYDKTLNTGWKFNPIAMPDGSYCVTEQEINECNNQDLDWIKSLPLVDYTTSIPDTTPPTEMGVGVYIHPKYNVLGFWDAKQFKLGGFIVPLVDYGDGLAVDLAYLLWEGFRLEQDKPIHETTFREFSKLWYELKTKAENNDLVQL